MQTWLWNIKTPKVLSHSIYVDLEHVPLCKITDSDRRPSPLLPLHPLSALCVFNKPKSLQQQQAAAGLCYVVCAGRAGRLKALCSVNCGQDEPAPLSHAVAGSLSADLLLRRINVWLAAQSVRLIDCWCCCWMCDWCVCVYRGSAVYMCGGIHLFSLWAQTACPNVDQTSGLKLGFGLVYISREWI